MVPRIDVLCLQRLQELTAARLRAGNLWTPKTMVKDERYNKRPHGAWNYRYFF